MTYELPNMVPVFADIPDDPDDLPKIHPDGFLHIVGSTIFTEQDAHGFVECRLALGEIQIDFAMSLAEAMAFIDILTNAMDGASENVQILLAGLQSNGDAEQQTSDTSEGQT